VVVADTGAAFADALVALFSEPARRAALAAAGRAAVHERYEWAPIARRFAGIVAEVAGVS
jgi:hypothetical protein